MYQLKAKVNFYDKEHPGVLLHPGELLSTKSEERVKDLVARGFAEIVSTPVTPAEQPAVAEKGSETEIQTEAPAEQGNVVVVSEDNLADVRQALNAIGVKTAGNAGLKKVAEKVAELSEAQMAELKEQLTNKSN